MNIGMIYQGGEFPPAERIEKEAKSLSRCGHQIFLLCNNYGKFSKHQEKVGDVNIRRILPTFPSYYLNKVLKFPVFLNPIWFVQIFIFAVKNRIEVFHVVDIPLAPAALAIGRILRIPVVFDMWEPYPECLKEWNQDKWLNKIVKNHHLAKVIEDLTLRYADNIITVVEEKRDHLIETGISSNRISIISNAVDLESFKVTVHDFIPSEIPILMYVGAINRPRGLIDIVNACKIAQTHGLKLKCIIAGDGDQREFLKSLSRDNNTENMISFPGWINFDEVPNYIASSTLCLIPHMKTPTIELTIPNKLFQYMSLGKPVLVSNAKPLQRIVEECQCGYVFKSGDPVDAYKMIEASIQNPEENHKRGLNGHDAVMNKYNWTLESQKLVEIYNDLRL